MFILLLFWELNNRNTATKRQNTNHKRAMPGGIARSLYYVEYLCLTTLLDLTTILILNEYCRYPYMDGKAICYMYLGGDHFLYPILGPNPQAHNHTNISDELCQNTDRSVLSYL